MENIGGSLLLICPKYNVMWISNLATEKIRVQLKEMNYAHTFKYVRYKYTSYLLAPAKSRSKVMFPEKC